LKKIPEFSLCFFLIAIYFSSRLQTIFFLAIFMILAMVDFVMFFFSKVERKDITIYELSTFPRDFRWKKIPPRPLCLPECLKNSLFPMLEETLKRFQLWRTHCMHHSPRQMGTDSHRNRSNRLQQHLQWPIRNAYLHD